MGEEKYVFETPNKIYVRDTKSSKCESYLTIAVMECANHSFYSHLPLGVKLRHFVPSCS